jgi:hypothetical protein
MGANNQLSQIAAHRKKSASIRHYHAGGNTAEFS